MMNCNECTWKEQKEKKYTLEEIRPVIAACIRDSATIVGLYYKHLPKEIFEKATIEMWDDWGRNHKGSVEPKGDVRAFAENMCYLIRQPNSIIEGSVTEHLDDDKSIMRFIGGCAYLDAWRELGLSDEEVRYLCKLSAYSDIAFAEVSGLDFRFEETMADEGCDHCIAVMQRRENQNG